MRLTWVLLFTAFAAAQENVPGTRITIWPPVEMKPATRFAGYESPDGKAALMITELPATSGDVTAAFRDPDKAAAAGMRLIEIDHATLPSGPVEIFVMEQTGGGIPFLKQIVVLRDAAGSALLVAMNDRSLDLQWAPVLRATLISAKLNPSPVRGNSAAFSIEPKGNLREAKAFTGSMGFTLDGKFPLSDPRGPVFLAVRSLNTESLSDLRRFAESRLRQMPNVKELRVTAEKPVTAGGLEGLELNATGNESSKESATFLYAVMLRDGAEGGISS